MYTETLNVAIKMEEGCADLMPVKAHHDDACYDAYAAEDVLLKDGDVRAVSLGFRVEVPVGWEMQVRMRSGLALKAKLMLANGVGTIDAGYRGIVGAILCLGSGSNHHLIRRGDRIAQLAFAKVPDVTFMPVTELSESSRGTGGFGSTGTGKIITDARQKLQVARCVCGKEYISMEKAPPKCDACGSSEIKEQGTTLTATIKEVTDNGTQGTGTGSPN